MIAGGTSGKGLAVNRRTGTQTYMKMLQVQGGLGFGVSKNQLIFVFTSEQALSNFINVGLGVRRPGQPVGDGGRRRGNVHRRRANLAGRLPIPDHRDRSQRHAYRGGNQVLRRLRSELTAARTNSGCSATEFNGPDPRWADSAIPRALRPTIRSACRATRAGIPRASVETRESGPLRRHPPRIDLTTAESPLSAHGPVDGTQAGAHANDGSHRAENHRPVVMPLGQMNIH